MGLCRHFPGVVGDGEQESLLEADTEEFRTSARGSE